MRTVSEQLERQIETEDLEWFELLRTAPPREVDVVAALGEELEYFADLRVPPGSRVGIAVGSRGIARVAEVVAAAIAKLRNRGVALVLVPAMGSHGGATGIGQVKILHELGVDENVLGVLVDSSTEVQEIGKLSGGQLVHLACAALRCDAIIPINGIKPHTELRAPIESGLSKMSTIGLGKEQGALSLNSAGFEAFADVLPEAVGIVMGILYVPFGIALLEDAWHRLHRAEVVAAELLLERDRTLVSEAWGHFARLPFEKVEVLVLREMGRTISRTGMDPNVTGRFPGKGLTAASVVGRLVVLDLTQSSGGNAVGVGLADVVTERLRSKVDWDVTYANVMASKVLANARLPFVVGNDFEALMLALASLTGASVAPPHIVAMANTLEVHHIAVSKPLVPKARKASYSRVGSSLHAEFGEQGNLLRIGGLEFFPGTPGLFAAGSASWPR